MNGSAQSIAGGDNPVYRRGESRSQGNVKTTSYAYDHAGRLIKEKTGSKGSEVGYSYDTRCNLLSVSIGGRLAEEYFYAADRLTGLDLGAGAHPFSYDSRGRTLGDYTPNGGRGLTYNNYLNRVSATSSVNFSYLADGEKTCSLTKDGEVGLIYRGPFVFRQDNRGERALEGVECPEGKLTAEKSYIYIKDHLGSVVSVVNGTTGEVVESSEYDAYGRRTKLQSSGDEAESRLLREHFTGKEDQMPEFGIDYTDFGARLYSPTIRRWLTPDPLSEKYYGISPYAHCAGNPVNFIDPDGKRVKVSNTDVLDIIRKTVPIEAREFITIDGNNYIEFNVMKNYSGDSKNFRHLKEMVQNTNTVKVELSDHFISRSRGGELEIYYMNYTDVDYLFVDKEIEQTTGLTTGETGFYGKTLFPGTHAVQNSPDNNIHVIINPLFSEIGKIEGFVMSFMGMHIYS